MKLVSILRIKDQIQTIDECLTKLSELVDEIIVLDNCSTDGTFDVYKKYPKIIEILQTVGFDEGRDKIMLLDAAKKRSPDWIMWIDADEVFEKHFTRTIIESYMNSSYNRITFRMCNFGFLKLTADLIMNIISTRFILSAACGETLKDRILEI